MPAGVHILYKIHTSALLYNPCTKNQHNSHAKSAVIEIADTLYATTQSDSDNCTTADHSEATLAVELNIKQHSHITVINVTECWYV